MRRLPLLISEQDSDFVAGLNSGSPAQIPPFTKAETVQLAASKVVRIPQPASAIFRTVPWDSTTMRASLGLIDAPPETGSVKFQVGATTSAAVAYPTDLSTTGIATWKAQCLTAINAIAGANQAVASDPPGAPPHFLYFTWLDPADDREITAVECTLAPLVAPRTLAQRGAPGYQQLIRLAQLPLRETVDFALEDAAQPTLTTQRIGEVGTNAMQRLTIPAGSAGSLELSWSGTKARLLPIPGATATSIATALNAIVADGTTHPSFAVNAVPGAGGTFDIEFIGPLAAAPQPNLGAVLYPSIPPTVAVATLALTHPRFAKILNGARKATVQLEFVWVDAGGNEAFIIRDVTLLANMTTGATAQEAEDAGGVITETVVVHIPPDGQLPFATIAPGTSFSPPVAIAASVAQDITLPFSTRQPFGKVFYKDPDLSDHWRPMAEGGEFTYESISNTHVLLVFMEDITDSGNPADVRDKSRFKIFFSAPDAVVEIFGGLKVIWDNVVASLPDGQSLTAKLAALETAIATLAGGLKINPSSIDLPALVRAVLVLLLSDPALKQIFTDVLKTVIADESVLAVILNTIKTNATLLAQFTDLLTTSLTSAELISAIAEKLFESSTFLDEFRKRVIEAFQAGGTLPPGFIPFAFADLEMIVPSIHERAGPSVAVTTGSLDTTNTAVTTTETGSATTTTKQTVPTITNVPTKIQDFELLPCELVAFTTGATIAGTVRLSDFVEGQTRTASDTVSVRTIGARSGVDHPAGTILGRRNSIIFPVRIDGANAWPVEMERRFFPVQLDDGPLYLGSRFALNFVLQTQLLGNAHGRIDFIIETGTFSHEGAETRDINLFTWTPIMTRRVPLTEALSGMSVAVAITRSTLDVREGTLTLNGKTTSTFVVPALPFGMRSSLMNFDAENIATGAKGSLVVRIKSPAGSIAGL